MLSIGLTPNKTKTISTINVPDEYYFDFLRGHHDGDGSFHSYFDPRWPASFMFYLTFASASPAHIRWLQTTNKRLAGVQGHVAKSKGHSVIQLRYAKSETLLLLMRMYANPRSPCLERKRLKISKALRIVDESLAGPQAVRPRDAQVV